MQVPPEIALSGVEMTPFIDKLITDGISKLEQVCNYIISTRIALEFDQKRHLTGNAYRMRIDIRVPGQEIVVKRSSKANKKPGDEAVKMEGEGAAGEEPEPEKDSPLRHSTVVRRGRREEELPVLIRRTFEIARRELETIVEKQRREVKVHPEQLTVAVIERLFPSEGYGFLRTLDGEQVYFNRNSVLHSHWERLAVGAGVRYTPEMGEKGVQASTVELVQKRGSSEMHGDLHDLPQVEEPARVKRARLSAK
jgi:cold shock CspA family protein